MFIYKVEPDNNPVKIEHILGSNKKTYVDWC